LNAFFAFNKVANVVVVITLKNWMNIKKKLTRRIKVKEANFRIDWVAPVVWRSPATFPTVEYPLSNVLQFKMCHPW
jgi:hypothetical protein